MTIRPLLACLLLGSCAAFRGATPAGFAPWSDNGGRRHRAAAPDGVVWTIRTEANRPRADLAFWKRALRERLAGAQYRIVDSLEFRMGGASPATVAAAASDEAWMLAHERALQGIPAFALEAADGDQAWLVAIAPHGKRIVVVEASGPLEAWTRRREAVLAALWKIEPR